MDYILICLLAGFGAGLTLFSGFGLGTILVPIFAIYFPVEQAILLTAIVHFLNNVFKLGLLGKFANLKIVYQFGIPSILAAFLGAFLLSYISNANPIFKYTLAQHEFIITPVKLIIGIVLVFFSLFDVVPQLTKIEFDKKYLILGGFLSGFFGGLSGNQGALRSAFLIRANLSKESFIATGVVIACLIDISRLSVYSTSILNFKETFNYPLLVTATLSAFLGTYFGNKLIKKMTVRSLQLIVAIAISIFGCLMSVGII